MKRKNSLPRSLLFCSVLVFGLISSNATHTHADTFSPNGEVLPAIDAREFKSTPIKKSHTGRVYQFKTETAQLPKTGSVILFKDSAAQPIMAFRVLQTDPTRSEYVAKRVRRYDQVGELKMGEAYTSTEKIAEVLEKPEITPEPTPEPPAPVLTASAPVTENSEATVPATVPAPVEANATPIAESTPVPSPTPEPMNVEAFDQELDQGTSQNLNADKPERVAQTKTEALPEEADDTDHWGSEDDEDSSVVTDERKRLSPFPHMLTVGGAFFSNLSNFSNGGGTSTGFAASYATILDRDLYFHGKGTQDSLAAEFGLSYYSIVNFGKHNDEYTLLPLRAELHYNLDFSSSFSLFGYLGLQYNYILGQSQTDPNNDPDKTVISKIQGIQPTVGLGLLYNIGPQWYLRLDLGWDRIGAGLSVQW